VVDVAGGGDHQVRRLVVAPVEPEHLVAAHAVDAGDGPEDRPAERVPGPQRLGEQVVHEVVGRVLVHVDLLEDHLPLALEVLPVEDRALEHVAQ
jgi:hypothetical protein